MEVQGPRVYQRVTMTKSGVCTQGPWLCVADMGECTYVYL